VNGTLEGLASGDLTAWVAVAFAVIYGVWLFDRKFPDPDDAVKALE
jgi:hypothetical protein